MADDRQRHERIWWINKTFAHSAVPRDENITALLTLTNVNEDRSYFSSDGLLRKSLDAMISSRTESYASHDVSAGGANLPPAAEMIS